MKIKDVIAQAEKEFSEKFGLECHFNTYESEIQDWISTYTKDLLQSVEEKIAKDIEEVETGGDGFKEDVLEKIRGSLSDIINKLKQ